MKLKFLCSLAAVAALSVAAFSQTGTSSALPSAPGTANDPPAITPNPNATKVAAINVETAIFMTNEGQRDMGALQKKFEPKTSDLKSKNDELEALKKQLTATGVTQEKKDDLNRQIEVKQKAFERERQDAQEDFQGQQTEIGQRIFQKMAPVIMKYAADHDFGIIIDTSNPWPQGPVLFAGPAVDITKPVVEAYNAKSGVAAPAAPAKPASTRPTSTRPATHSGTTSTK